MNYNLNSNMNAAIKQLKENWNWYLILGITLVALGSLAIIFSFVSTIYSVIYIGIFMVILGLAEGAKSLKITEWGTFFLHLFLSILYVVAGLFIAFHPAINALSLTLLLSISFIIAGILRIFFALTQNVPHKGWLLFNGALTLLLGGLILYQWPSSGLWVIGTLVGIDAIFTGWTWIMLSLVSKNLKSENLQNKFK